MKNFLCGKSKIRPTFFQGFSVFRWWRFSISGRKFLKMIFAAKCILIPQDHKTRFCAVSSVFLEIFNISVNNNLTKKYTLPAGKYAPARSSSSNPSDHPEKEKGLVSELQKKSPETKKPTLKKKTAAKRSGRFYN